MNYKKWTIGDQVFYVDGSGLGQGVLVRLDLVPMHGGGTNPVWIVRPMGAGLNATTRVTANNLMPSAYALYTRLPDAPHDTPWQLDGQGGRFPSYTRAIKTAERLGRVLGNGCHTVAMPIAPGLIDLPETIPAGHGLDILYRMRGRVWVDETIHP